MHSSRGERRRETRDQVDVPLGILSTDGDGRETRFQARLVDISLTGAKMTVPQRLARSTTVYFYCQKFGIGGRGSVRYCERRKQGYEVGLEFPSGTGWKGLGDSDLLALVTKVNGVAMPAAVAQAGDPAPAL